MSVVELSQFVSHQRPVSDEDRWEIEAAINKVFADSSLNDSPLQQAQLLHSMSLSKSMSALGGNGAVMVTLEGEVRKL